MLKFSINRKMQVEISGITNADELLKVKRLPLREYDHARDLWIVPVRPGLAASIHDVFKFEGGFSEFENDIWKAGEEYFLELIAPPVAVDPWKIGAGAAVELATLHHLYTFHKGDRAEYAKIHAPYQIGE